MGNIFGHWALSKGALTMVCVRLIFVFLYTPFCETQATTPSHNRYMQSEAEHKKRDTEWERGELTPISLDAIIVCAFTLSLSLLPSLSVGKVCCVVLLSEKNSLQINLSSLNSGSTKAAASAELWKNSTQRICFSCRIVILYTQNLCMYTYIWCSIRTCDKMPWLRIKLLFN